VVLDKHQIQLNGNRRPQFREKFAETIPGGKEEIKKENRLPF
jgi:hypothetical protein